MIAIARTLSNASRRCHPAADHVCKRSVTSMSVFSNDDRLSHYICRNEVLGMHHSIYNRAYSRCNDRSYIRRFASHTVQQQEEDEDENSVDEIDKKEEDLMAEVHEANERCVLILCSRNMQSLHIDYSPFTNLQIPAL